MANMLKLLYNNKIGLPSLPPADTFAGQTILITGATSGLGLAAAVHFVNLNASTVIITARTAAKGEVAKATIESQTGSSGKDIVKVMELDMSTFAATKAFAEHVKKEVGCIDVVLLNAGIFPTSFRLGKEGYEDSIEVNVLSTTLLGVSLLPWMKTAGKGKAHLIFVTSGLHRRVKIIPEDFPQNNVLAFFSKAENWPKGGMYPVNKLLEQYCVNEIAKLAVGSDGTPQVTVTPMCPGMVRSNLAREYKTNILMSIAVEGFMITMSKTTEAGARSLVLAATSKENGRYYTDYQNNEDYENAVQHNILSPEGKKMQAQVWEEVISALSAKVPEFRKETAGVVGTEAQI